MAYRESVRHAFALCFQARYSMPYRGALCFALNRAAADANIPATRTFFRAVNLREAKFADV